jgi:hypothetical protein
MVISAFNGSTSKIKFYQDTFAKLKSDLLGQGTLVTEIAVLQISAKAEEIGE